MPGRYTPQVQEAITRLGSRLPFKEAQEELEMMWGIEISTAGVRDITLRNGRVANELVEAEVARLQAEAPEASAPAEQLVMCADGALVQVRNGEWREVKTVAFGEFEAQWDAKKKQVLTKTNQISYFSRVDKADTFAEMALYEWHQRGGDKAKQVVAVNDGALWIQAFIDYHCPQAIRVIDFAHAQAYLATIGKALYGAETEAFQQWYGRISKQLGQKPPHRTLNELRFLQASHQDHPDIAEIEQAVLYLERRQEMIDYAHFRNQGVPIGSGIVESGHKVVMQRRMKQAGMRWAEDNLNPMLALRMAVCNRRWKPTWQNIQRRWLLTKRQRRLTSIGSPQPQPETQTITEADVQRMSSLASRLEAASAKRRPWPNNRWIFPHRPPLSHKN
ncbi:MAG: ISKra4 family transposase [Candidatus Promineifilaceae bacterium]